MIFFLIINYYYRKQFSKYLKLYLEKSDKRMRITTETFNNLKVIKLYGWDNIFLEKIDLQRKEELLALDKRYFITTISQTLLWLAPISMSICSIGVYQYLNESFKIEDIFTCLAIFTSIQGPMRNLPTTFDIILEAISSLKRVETFLKLPEIESNKILKNDNITKKNGIDIQIINGCFNWGKTLINKNNQNNTNNKKNIINTNINKNIELSKINTNKNNSNINNNDLLNIII